MEESRSLPKKKKKMKEKSQKKYIRDLLSFSKALNFLLAVVSPGARQRKTDGETDKKGC